LSLILIAAVFLAITYYPPSVGYCCSQYFYLPSKSSHCHHFFMATAVAKTFVNSGVEEGLPIVMAHATKGAQISHK